MAGPVSRRKAEKCTRPDLSEEERRRREPLAHAPPLPRSPQSSSLLHPRETPSLVAPRDPQASKQHSHPCITPGPLARINPGVPSGSCSRVSGSTTRSWVPGVSRPMLPRMLEVSRRHASTGEVSLRPLWFV